MGKTYSYTFQENLIARVSEYLLTRACARSRDLSRIAVVFPGKRPALFLKQELAKGLRASFIPPRSFSIDEFVEYAADDRSSLALPNLDACYLMYTLARERAPQVCAGREAFSQFLPWARELLSFIDHLDLEDVAPERLRGIQSKAHIGYDVPQSINLLLESVIDIRQAYHASLVAQGARSRGMLYRAAVERSKERTWEEFDEVLFCGFFYLSRTESGIMKALYESGKGSFFFQGSQEEWRVLAQAAKDLSVRIVPEKQEAGPAPIVEIKAGFDMHSQVGLIRQQLKEGGLDGSTVIVMPNPEGVIPLLSELSSLTGDYNVSMGYPLRRSALFALVQGIAQAQATIRGGAYYAKDYLKVLAHPLVKNLNFCGSAGVTRIIVHKIEEILLGVEESPLGGSLFISLDALLQCRPLFDSAMASVKSIGEEVTFDELKSIVRGMHDLLFNAWEQSNAFGGFAASLTGLIDTLVRKSPLTGYPLNVAMAQRIASVAQELAMVRFAGEQFPKDEMFRVLIDTLEHEVVSFAGSPLKGLQVLGLFETRLLHFDTVIIADLNESILPSLTVYEPLIPREVMISLGLDRLEKEEEIQRYLFRRLVDGSRRALLVYEDTPEKEKSRFLEELLWQRQKAQGSIGEDQVPKASFKVKILPLRLSIPKSEAIIARLRQMRYSASGLNTYLACPLQFYFQQVLRLKEKEGFLLEPEAKDVGTFLHRLFEEAFLPWIGKAPRIDAQFRKKFFALLDERFGEFFGKRMRSDAFMIRSVVDAAMERFLEYESHRALEQIISLEKTFTASLQCNGEALLCKAVVDRIDRLHDGTILIVDYKTGGSDIMPSVDAERIERRGFSRQAIAETIQSLQLPLYIRLVQQHFPAEAHRVNAGLYFIKSAARPAQFKPLFDSGVDDGARQRLMALYSKALEALVAEILDQAVPFCADPDPRRCAHCAYGALCR